MTVDNWVFPRLNALPGAWKRYWVQLVAFPQGAVSIFGDTALTNFCLCLSEASATRKMMDAHMRRVVKKEKQALKMLQKGSDVRDIPGADAAIITLEEAYEDLLSQAQRGDFLAQEPVILEALSKATMMYTFRPDLEHRVVDHLLGSKGRDLADQIAQHWLSTPPMQFLNHGFHPLADHFQVSRIDRETQELETDAGTIERSEGQIPCYAPPHGGTNPATFPYKLTYVGPTPPVFDPPDSQTLVQKTCTLNLFDVDWPGSTEEAENPAVPFAPAPLVPFSRAFQVDSLSAWKDLVTRYPLRFTNPDIRQEFTRLTGKKAEFYGVDWESARKDFDVVHFCFQAVLECSDVGVDLDALPLAETDPNVSHVAVMYRCVPGSTIWLNL